MVLPLLARLLKMVLRQRPDLQLIMYTRHQCPLCDEAWRLLEENRNLYGYRLEKVDIDASPDLRARYDQCVPVVEINGKVRFRGKVNPVLLQRILEAG
ncbi:MAG: glutaredoxin family protein [Gemmataceae bacterium]|nr:glutaredoxin family protein [Gemmataceae bacterium]